MNLPHEMPVMTLPGVTLFPQALLPLYIFEPRYRQMLADALESDRMFAVVMNKPGSQREVPLPVAGLGLVRVSVGHRDGTSHLILQGLTRVGLEQTVRYKPYRIHRIKTLETPPCDSVAADALLARVRELMKEWIRSGLPLQLPGMSIVPGATEEVKAGSLEKILEQLETIVDPGQAVDQISCLVLPDAVQRQTIMETLEVEARLRRLIQFLLAEIHKRRKG